jgi:hypothetical protein
MTHTGTVFDALLAALGKAGEYNRDDAVPPACVLWPDEKREWEPLAARLRAVLPHFFTLGGYDPAARTGPAIWLRCVLANVIPEVPVPVGTIPFIYLPGVGKATLKTTEDCEAPLKPLVELQFRGTVWTHVNGKDWTLGAFLTTEKGGLGLSPGKDQATAAAVRRAVEKLADIPVAELAAKSAAGELTATYFDGLLSEDPVDDLLAWLADPTGTRGRWDAGRWEALCSRCRADYGFDPTAEGELGGAELLATQPKTAWKSAWKRFTGSPGRYAGLEPLLRKAKPKKVGLNFGGEEVWPQDNEAEEKALREALAELTAETVAKARETIQELDSRHGPRRDWVWAKLNRAPLAEALWHLTALASATAAPLSGATPDAMAVAYTGGGWKADAAAVDALAAVSSTADREAVSAVVTHLYGPWLRDAAELFQQRVKATPLPGPEVPKLDPVAAGTCVLFADALRYDVAQKFLGELTGRVGVVQAGYQFAAVPSVTPTAKPAVSPVAAKLCGRPTGDFTPSVAADDKPLTTDRFRKLLDSEGVQYLAGSETGDPAGKGWTEFGTLDQTGHAEGVGLARRIPELVRSLVERIELLFAAGWQEVRVVTDHGWLLLPGGLPKCDLPKYLTETRWGRCAVVKPGADVEFPCADWFWADGVRVASPTGVGCFFAGNVYSHGGQSVQECVVPRITIRAATVTSTARIESVRWTRFRCRIHVVGAATGSTADLRDRPADPGSTLTGAKSVGTDGTVSLVVTDDGREGSATTAVLLDPSGAVVARRATTVGEE